MHNWKIIALKIKRLAEMPAFLLSIDLVLVILYNLLKEKCKWPQH
jgi:hypothetical protein